MKRSRVSHSLGEQVVWISGDRVGYSTSATPPALLHVILDPNGMPIVTRASLIP